MCSVMRTESLKVTGHQNEVGRVMSVNDAKKRQLFALRVGRVDHSKVLYIQDLADYRIYVETKDVLRLIDDLKRVKAEIDEDGKAKYS